MTCLADCIRRSKRHLSPHRCAMSWIVSLIMVGGLCTLLRARRVSSANLAACEGCIMWNGVGYKPTDDCTKYRVCVFHKDGTIDEAKTKVKTCPFGLFWAQDRLACMNARVVTCPNDPCKELSVNSYPSSDRCRQYWTCSKGRSYGASCCPKFQRARQTTVSGGDSCFYDQSCDDVCGPVKIAPTNYCRINKEDPDSPDSYWTLHHGDYIKRDCPDRLIYDKNLCYCVTDGRTYPRPSCQRDLYLPLHHDFKDHSGHGAHVGTRNPEIARIRGALGEKAAIFRGHEQLTIARYANAYFGNSFVIRMRLLEIPGNQKGPMTLISNGCDNIHAPIHVTIDENGLIVAQLRVSGFRTRTRTLRLQTARQPKTVTLAYNGNRILLRVQYSTGLSQSNHTSISGTVPSHHCALVFGAETNPRAEIGKNFKGFMEEVQVYMCIPKSVNMRSG